MGYSDNPRKVFGRVEIIYADEELSRDITTEESGNSEISHPKEVYHLPSEPTRSEEHTSELQSQR